jgi:hypothetical protein
MIQSVRERGGVIDAGWIGGGETETGKPIQSRTEDGADGGVRTLWRQTDGLPAAGRERNRARKRASQRERPGTLRQGEGRNARAGNIK